MAKSLITTTPSPWGRRARTAGWIAVATAAVAAHLVIAVIVLALRIAYAVITVAATGAAYAELYLTQHTGRRPYGQITGVALITAFGTGFRDAYRQTTTR